MKKLTLEIHPGELAVWKTSPGGPMPSCPRDQSGFWSFTRTEKEMSVVSDPKLVPEGVAAKTGWKRLSVAGELDLSMTGVLVSIAGPLAGAGISIFTVSTFDTDHVLIGKDDLSRALEVLKANGHTIQR